MKRQYFIILFISLFIFSGFITSDTDIYFKINKSIELFGRVYKETAVNYVDDIDPASLMEAGIEGMLNALDPYTVYLDESHQNDIDLITKGKYGGIGATVGIRNDMVTVVDLIEGYSAQRQGIRIGDVIVEIDGNPISKKTYNNLGSFMKGEPGSIITIIIKREGESENLKFNLIREEIEVRNVTYFGFIPQESSNLYIKLSGFSRAAGEEVKDAIIEMGKTREIKSIVLDLRGNPGGLLDAAIDVSEKFLGKDKLVVSVVGRDSTAVRKYYSKEEPVAKNIKLAVLIDSYSASAAEIVTGAIQDHDRGIVVGDKSFGKGLVQTIIPMPYNASLKITTAKYYTPSGRCIQKIDYSQDNEVFVGLNKLEKNEYKTGTNRPVYSKGGIKPDSLVKVESESELVKQLLAHGMFFRFVTTFFSNGEEYNKYIDTPDLLYENFLNYLETQKFEFKFELDEVLDELKTIIAERNYESGMPQIVDNLIHEFEGEKLNELNYYKDDIIKEIRLEIVNRIDGRIGRIKESLRGDEQFDVALELLNSKSKYKKILNSVE